ncbi:MAG: orotidine-5'-phosphate decarboxylase [Dehalococcoidia bacterium]|nr:orotidine-5'-phosphate decarboxylase [Dehalococcoidia bacterium]MDZ4246997.1 orotidine-5'-phosphate decarboxylase [Dehalococcoidia bacterium]
MKFAEKITAASLDNNSLLCVGLDPDPNLLPGVGILEFNKAIIDATSDVVCAYKPNLAFYEAMGMEGWDALKKTVEYIPRNIAVIGDGKRADIGNTTAAYARGLFEFFGFDAVTVNPYMGFDSLEPFLKYADRGIFILCRTSNKGSMDFQSLECKPVATGAGVDTGSSPLFEIVAEKARLWNRHGNIGLVVGATYPGELQRVRQLCPDMWLLIPGVGTQGGDMEITVKYGIDAGNSRAIINSSRQVIYASKEDDFARAAGNMARKLRNNINSFRPNF